MLISAYCSIGLRAYSAGRGYMWELGTCMQRVHARACSVYARACSVKKVAERRVPPFRLHPTAD